MKRIILIPLAAVVLFAGSSVSAATLSPNAADLFQLLTPLPTVQSIAASQTSPVLATSGASLNAPAVTTPVNSPTSAADVDSVVTTTPVNAIDMSANYLTLSSHTYASSYTYPSQRLNPLLTKRLYEAAAGMISVGLILALGLVERVQAFEAMRMLKRAEKQELA